MLQRRQAGNVVFYRSALLAAAGVAHGFSTRIGGVSVPPFDALNLGQPTGAAVQDDADRIAANWALFQSAIGCADLPRHWVRQVHGGDVARLAADGGLQDGQPADAIVSGCRGRVLTIRVADCVPVLLATRDGAAVAAVHAGWRGVVAGIVPAAVAALGQIAGGPPRDLVAAIGPCIGADCYEVGQEVAAALVGAVGQTAIRPLAGGKALADLRGAVMTQLLTAGLAAQRVDTTDRCTFRDADEFYSHRRDHGLTGRMAAAIAPASAE